MRRAYRWTPEQDEMLREGYRSSRNRADISGVLTRVCTLTGFPRHEAKQRARELELTVNPNTYWSKEHVEFLMNHAGEKSMSQIAKILGRSYRSVRAKVSSVGISGQLRDGYSGRDLASIFGVAEETVGKWERRKWLSRGHNAKFSDASLQTFIRQHPAEYDLRRVDQVWFKGLMFGDAECYLPHHAMKISESMLEHRIAEMMSERGATA